MRSCWPCTLEREEDGSLSLRLGLRFARGLRETAAVALEEGKNSPGFRFHRRTRASGAVALPR